MLNIILGLIAQLIFIVLSWRRPLYGLCFIIVLLPSYLWRFSIVGMPTTFLELMIVWLFIIWLIKNNLWQRINWQFKSSAENLVPKTWRYLISAWLLVSILAVLHNPTLAALGLWRAYFLEPIIFFIMFVYLVKTASDLKLVIKSLGFLLFGLFIIAIYQNITDWNLPLAYNLPHPRRLTAVFSYPNALGLLVAPLTAFFAGLYLINHKRQPLYLALFFVGFLLIWWAMSQGAIAGIIFSLAVYGFYLLIKFLQAHYSYKSRLIFYALIVVLLIFLWFKNPLALKFQQELFQPQLNQLTASSLEIRSNQWQETMLMLKDHWWSGAGLSAYQSTMTPYRQYDWIETYLYPHNLFLNFWSELGLLGLLSFLTILYFLIQELKKLFQNNNILAWPLLLMWLTWLIHGLVDVPYFKNDLSVLFFIQLALLLISKRLSGKFTF